MNRTILAALAVIVSLNCFAQGQMTASETRYDWSGLAEGITKGKTNNYDKAYAIYRWLCDNIAYDTSYTIYDADTAYEQKRGVCQAYSEMFYRLGEALGIKVDIISGKSKDNEGKISDKGHAWVFVRTDGNAGILVDPTWGAGSVKNGKFTRSEDDDTWFHVDPAWMIFTHFPEEEAYQLLGNKIDYSTFASLPPFYPSLKKFGYKGDEVLSSSLAGQKPDLPECIDNSKIEVAKMPLEGTLRVGQSYDFILKPTADYEFVVINGNDHNREWIVNDGYHLIKYVPGNADEVKVDYRKRGTQKDWIRLLTYKVAKPTSDDIANLEKVAPHKSPAFSNVKNFDADRLRKRGVDLGKLLATVKRDNIRQVPLIYDAGDFKLNDVPLNGKLKVGETYQFAFSPYEEGDWVIINNGKFTHDWKQDPQTRAWVMTVVPEAAGKVVLAFKPQGDTGNSYSYCVEYEAD